MLYKFKIGDKVRVAPNKKDPGGVGTVTARESKEDDRGVAILYRVLIADHPDQGRVAAEKKRRNDGFWYKEELVSA